MARNKGDFHQYKFQYSGAEPWGPGGTNVVTAVHPEEGHSVGFLAWRKDTGEVLRVEVDPEHQRKGVATGMWNFAKNIAANSDEKIRRPQHSIAQSKAGKAWAKKVGK